VEGGGGGGSGTGGTGSDRDVGPVGRGREEVKYHISLSA